MRIVLLTDDLPPEAIGGSGRVVAEAAAELVRRGHHVTAITGSAHERWPYKSDYDVRTVKKLPPRFAHYHSVFSRRREREIVSHLRDLKPDIIHAHGIAWNIGYRWIPYTRKQKIPSLYTAHGMMHISYGKLAGDEKSVWWVDLKRARWTYNPLRNALIHNRLSSLDALISVSEALRIHLQAFGYPNTTVLHNGIDTDFWVPQEGDAIQRNLGIPADAFVFLLAGRLGWAKGLDCILDIWPSLKGEPHLILAGHVPPDIAGRIPRVHSVSLQDRSGMRSLYAACNVNLVPSLCFDCFPTTSLESMACERIALVTNRGGGKEAIREGETGFVINPRDPESVRQRMQWCIGHPDDVRRMGKRASEHIRSEFSLSHHVDRLLDLYTSLQGESQRKPSGEAGG
jgi:glycosyltransferase involved in cell wall biosynthesis